MTADDIRTVGIALLALCAGGAVYAIREAHRHARDLLEAREDPGGHVRTLPELFDQDGLSP